MLRGTLALADSGVRLRRRHWLQNGMRSSRFQSPRGSLLTTCSILMFVTKTILLMIHWGSSYSLLGKLITSHLSPLDHLEAYSISIHMLCSYFSYHFWRRAPAVSRAIIWLQWYYDTWNNSDTSFFDFCFIICSHLEISHTHVSSCGTWNIRMPCAPLYIVILPDKFHYLQLFGFAVFRFGS